MRNLAHHVLLACALMAMLAGGAGAASESSSTTVSLTVPSVATIDASACAPATAGVTDFGQVLPGSLNLGETGPGACQVAFGSSNDTSRLEIRQADAIGSAMGMPSGYTAVSSENGGIWAMEAADASNIWRINADYSPYRIEYSGDGGASWSNQTNGFVWSLGVFSPSIVVALGNNGTMIRTIDGGSSWSTVGAAAFGGSLPTGTTFVHAASATVGYLSANNHVWKTTNAGASWSDLGIPLDASGTGNMTGTLEAIDSIDANNVVIGAWGGRPVLTSDGSTFQQLASGGCWNGNVIAMGSATSFIWGQYDTANVCGTTNGGASGAGDVSMDLDPDEFEFLGDVAALGATTYLIGDTEGNVHRSTDTGATTTMISTGDAGTVGIMADVGGGNMRAVVGGQATLASGDGGLTWSKLSGNWTMATLNGNGPGDLVALGGNGTILRSTNGLESWSPISSPTAEPMRESDALGDFRLAVGDNGTILRSTNDGLTWSTVPSGTGVDLKSVAIGSATTAWAGGMGGLILQTIDGGDNWTAYSAGTRRINSLAATSATNAFAVSYNRRVYRTLDGTTWTNQASLGGCCWQRGFGVFISPSGTIMAGAEGDAWEYSTNNGTSWSNFTAFGGCGAGSGLNGAFDDTSELFFPGTLVGTVVPTTGFSNVCGQPRPRDTLAFSATAYHVGDGERRLITTQGDEIDDWQDGVADWNDGNNAFGACLQALGGGATPVWTVDITGIAGECESDDADPWNAIPAAGDVIAATGTPGDSGTADLVFGFRPADDESAGQYYAPMVFTVIAPDV